MCCTVLLEPDHSHPVKSDGFVSYWQNFLYQFVIISIESHFINLKIFEREKTNPVNWYPKICSENIIWF